MHLSRRILSPRHLALYSIVAWFFLWALSPIEYLTPIRVEATLTFAGYIIAFFWGASLLARRANATIPVDKPWPSIPRNFVIGFWILLVLSAVGLLLRFYDLIVLKSYLTYESASAFRIQRQNMDLMAEEKGLISVVSSGLYPMAIIAFLIAIPFRRYLSRIQFWSAVLLLIPFIGYMALTGGRSYVISAAVMVGIAFLIAAGPKGIKLRFASRKFIIGAAAVGILGVGIVGYSTYVLQERKAVIGLEQSTAVEAFESDFKVRVREPFRSAILSEDSTSQATLAATFISFYFVHGFYWYNDLYVYRPNEPLTYGAAQYYLLARLLNFTGLVPPDTLTRVFESYPVSGVFYTFYGSVYVDYGVVGGLVYCFLFGAVCQIFYNKAMAGKLGGLMVYPFLGSVALHSMVVDMIASGGGTFYLLDMVIASGIFTALHLLAGNKSEEPKMLRLAVPS